MNSPRSAYFALIWVPRFPWTSIHSPSSLWIRSARVSVSVRSSSTEECWAPLMSSSYFWVSTLAFLTSACCSPGIASIFRSCSSLLVWRSSCNKVRRMRLSSSFYFIYSSVINGPPDRGPGLGAGAQSSSERVWEILPFPLLGLLVCV